MDVDLVAMALSELKASDKGKPTSLIRTMAEIYDRQLFGGATMDTLLKYAETGIVRNFSANATDFTNGLPFRFQATERVKGATGGKYCYGLIGNNKIPLERDMAGNIHLGDILACSSCFPGGFEPMVFPHDFNLPDEDLKTFSPNDSFGIMDGGIVDNQGIEPVLLAEERMRIDEPEKKDRCMDLIVMSDVSSPYMEGYSPAKRPVGGWIGSKSVKSLLGYVSCGELLATILLVSSFFTHSALLQSITGAIWLTLTTVWIAGALAKRKMHEFISQTVVGGHTKSILELNISEIATLLVNRASSLAMLATTVFMKHIRRLNYKSVYEDDGWKNRRMMNGIYELRAGESWTKERMPEWLRPSEAMQENSKKASSMGTTLWFTDGDKSSGIPQSLIAAGQYTICWNFLKYMEGSKKDQSNMSSQMIQLCKDIEPRLRADWEKFKSDPMWMLDM